MKIVLLFTLLLAMIPSLAFADGTSEGKYEPGENGTIYAQVLNASGSPVATATVTYTMRNSDGDTVLTGNLTYIAGSNGMYSADFTAPDDEGIYSIDIASVGPVLYGATGIQVKSTPSWWEDNIMLIALAIMLCAFTIAGYVLYKGELVIVGSIGFFLLGGYAYLQSTTGVSIVGTACILLGLVFFYTGATFWRSRKEEEEDEADDDNDDDDYNYKSLFDGRESRLSSEKTSKRKQPIRDKRRYRRETRDMDI